MSAPENPSAPAAEDLDLPLSPSVTVETGGDAPATPEGPSFASLGLFGPLLDTLDELGFECPTPVQAACIPALMAGERVLGTAQTGTGKTAAFALPLLAKLQLDVPAPPQVLVLAPTRELALQVAEAFVTLARRLPGFGVLPIYGGQDIRVQLSGLRRRPQVVVGTPGRLIDHLDRGSLDLSQVRGLVIDEADEMLRMGFIDDVERILGAAPEQSQRMLFSATMPPAIRRVATKYLGQAQEIRVTPEVRSLPNIKQRYLLVHGRDKLDALTRLLEVEPFEAIIVFVRTKSATVELAEKLMARGHRAAAINGDMNQASRERAIEMLRSGALDILVATDVAARGLDVARVSHVYNFDIPYDSEAYVHRIGRTGRAGREGEAVLFVTPKERRLLSSLERATGQPIEPTRAPSGQDVSAERIRQFERRLRATLEGEELAPMRALVAELSAKTDASPEELAAAMAFLAQQNTPLYPELPELEVKPRTERPFGGPRQQRGPEQGMARYRVEVGAAHNISTSNLVALLTKTGQLPGRMIGRIRLYDRYSTVDLSTEISQDMFRQLQRLRLRRQPLKLSRMDDDRPRGPWRSKKPMRGEKRFPKTKKPKRG